MPIKRVNEWITSKGTEYTKLHAFINCQGLRLTANRGSFENTPSDIQQDLREAVREIYDGIIQSDDWGELEWLESEAGAYNTVEKEKRDFKRRMDKVNRAKVAQFNGINLVEPQQENGVFSIFMQLSSYDEVIPPENGNDYTRYYLDSLRSERKIEVFVLKYYLKEKLNIEFAPRTEIAIV